MSKHVADTDLLGYYDAELSESLAAGIERHLEECPTCMGHYRALSYASIDAAAMCRGAADSATVTMPAIRERFSDGMRADVSRRWAIRAPMVLALTAALLFVTVRTERSILERSLFLERGALPMSSLTPGLAREVTTDRMCGETLVPPRVPSALRLQVLRDYGMEHVPEDQYELDYLITPELGGVTDRRNLWPEPYGLQSWNAHAKDSLEHLLPRLVCSGRIDLATAQREIASNWIEAYKKYLASDRPIQLHARVLLSNEPTGDW